jgi:NAD-dependent dihydropyrimidine dehydrogenase PreA subunit
MYNAYAINTLRYEEEKCIDCGFCIDVCPHAVFAQGEKAVVIDRYAACMECGACVINCPTDALSVEAGVGCAWYLYWQALKGETAACCSSQPC